MKNLESLAFNLRHRPTLRNADSLWRFVRPWYERLLRLIARKGLPRTFNGTDRLMLAPELHGFPDVYEPEVWKAIMDAARPGDIVADVGAFVGLYTVALAKRVGKDGRVFAFEPDPASLSLLERHIALNHVGECVEIVPHVVSDDEASVSFVLGRGSESYVVKATSDQGRKASPVTLDLFFEDRKVDLLKIDVEGFEEMVLRGARQLLSDGRRCPRAIFIEVHPAAWPSHGTQASSLLNVLFRCGYQVFDLAHRPVAHIAQYGEVVALKTARLASDGSIQAQATGTPFVPLADRSV